ncbi:hypothetical protein AERO9A_300003 [Aeromonas salmonicida]|nr:hypothetical protein AERO9A_300003 [Aeromonas salmonicida]
MLFLRQLFARISEQVISPGGQQVPALAGLMAGKGGRLDGLHPCAQYLAAGRRGIEKCRSVTGI